jgi:hypothetical protein
VEIGWERERERDRGRRRLFFLLSFGDYQYIGNYYSIGNYLIYNRDNTNIPTN